MASEILSFKLIGGDEIVAEVVGVKRGNVLTESTTSPITEYMVRRPHILQFQPVAPGKVGLAFVPWTLSNPTIERMQLPASAVILTFSPSENVEKQYIEQTSGIQLATPGQRIST